MSRFRSVGARLAAALLALLLGAFAIAYAVIVPSFERTLVRSKEATLERDAEFFAGIVGERSRANWQEYADGVQATFDARAIVFTYANGSLTLAADSNRAHAADIAADPVARRAAESRTRQRGAVDRGDGRYAEGAAPVPGNSGAVVLISGSLGDILETVELARRRLVIAGVLALCVVLALGYGGASLFARRLRRLERAADRIAGGRFDEPVVDRGADEIGQLAGAFERMRLRLAQLDRARSEFIGNASHELRTPLFSLGGFLELLDEEELDDETRAEFGAQMREQVDRLTKLATDLLDLSRLDAGRMSVERDRLELGSVAATVVSEFAARAQRGRHGLRLDVATEAQAYGDEQRALQIARILVDNALRHTPPGTAVTVRVGRADGAALLGVEDDGPGIPAESVGEVFERFYRLDGAVASGSGLGLAIARELAELMHGRLVLESQPGRTAFTLALAAVPAGEHVPA